MTYHRPPQAYECSQGNIAMCLLHSKIFHVQFLFFSGSHFAEDYIFSLPICVLVAHLKMIIWCKEITLKWCGVVIS